MASELALQTGLAVNLAGGYHHARAAMAHGFCLYADVALAIRHLRDSGYTKKILIVDTDAHQGDGNHCFFKDDPTVFSIHEKDIFPFPKLTGDLDIELQTGIEDDEYLTILKQSLISIFETFTPSLIFHVAGADILNDDPLTGMCITTTGLQQRDNLILNMALQRDIPLVYLLAGGYGPSSAKAQGLSIEAMLTIKQNYNLSHKTKESST